MAFLKNVNGNWYTVESYRGKDGKPKQRILRKHGHVKPKLNNSERERKLSVLDIKKKIKQKHLEHSNKQFEAILLDPPWHYHDERQDEKYKNRTPYPSMSFNEIRELPIPDLAKKDSYIFMWSTKDHLPDSFRLFQKWGIEYKQIITWVKGIKEVEGKNNESRYEPKKHNTGYWLRNVCEYCLLGRKGKAKSLTSRGLTNKPNFVINQLTENLEKPSEVYEWIEEFIPEGERLELFPKEYRDGWYQWGADFEK